MINVQAMPLKAESPILFWTRAYLKGLEKSDSIAKQYLLTRVPKQLQTQVYEQAHMIIAARNAE